MFCKSLYKQSWKSNRVMWLFVTILECFMLACVMLIAGNGNLGETKNAIENTVIKGELESQIKLRSINYYDISSNSLTYFDNEFISANASIISSAQYQLIYTNYGEEKANEYAYLMSYKEAGTKLQEYVNNLGSSLGYEEDSNEMLELNALVFFTLNVITQDESGTINYKFDEYYIALNEEAPRYDLTNVLDDDRSDYREKYAMQNASIFLAYNITNEENIEKILAVLSDYKVTKEQYAEFGFADYSKCKEIFTSVVINYRANLEYRLANIKDGETVNSIKEELTASSSGSLLSTLPSEVSDALQEIGTSDLYGVLVGSIFFKMAGLLLPIIYMIMTSNALVVNQVETGSMAYILSTGTKRKNVVFTQAMFLISTIFAMFLLTTITSVVCFTIVDVQTDLTYGKLLLINLGAFITMFAMSGICYFTSCYFDRSKYSMSIGGGLCMFFLVATMLGLFGSPVLPSIVRMNALNYFNYVSIISLLDVVSMLESTNAYLWKLAILLVTGIILFYLGSKKFETKDLPL